MRASTKKWLAAGIILVLLGGILFSCVMFVLGWDFTKLATVQYETNTYVFEESFSGISLQTDAADILFAFSEDGVCKVECYEAETERYSVSVRDGILCVEISAESLRRYIGINFGSPTITVYLPKREYDSLSVRGSTGDIEIPQDFSFGKADISLSTGNIRMENIAAGSLALSVSTGQVNASSVTCAGDLTVRVSTGEAYLADVSCKNFLSSGNTGDLSLRNVIAAEAFTIMRTTGDVTFAGCDAAAISVETDTGDVTGTLLSDKVFVTNTSTGDVDVPSAAVGGPCTIRTSTGDITMHIQ